MTVGRRLVLINSVLTSLTMFMLSFFEVPKGVLEKLDYYRSRFFWQSEEYKKKYRLAKWNILCQPKEFGGLVLAYWEWGPLSRQFMKMLN